MPTEVICAKKYCKYNELGVCGLEKIFINEEPNPEYPRAKGDSPYIAVCVNMYIIGDEG